MTTNIQWIATDEFAVSEDGRHIGYADTYAEAEVMAKSKKRTVRTVSELMLLAADGDSAAINVLDMIDANEQGARYADAKQLAIWYDASVQS